jgi:hypothetical protein
MKSLFLCSFLLLVQSPGVLTQDTGINNTGQKPETPASVNVTPDNLDFGEQVTKKPGKPRRLTLTNTGGKKLYINSVALSGDAQQDFTMSNDTCTGKDIEPGKSCIVDIVFNPAVNERRNATIIFTDNAVDSPQNIKLTGVGINSVAIPPSKSGQPE